MKVAFDVDETLITMNEAGENVPKYETIQLMRFFALNTDAEIIVWSGSGTDWAKRWTEKLGITHYVDKILPKGCMEVDIAVDDQQVKMGKANIQVK
jgi:phosphoserine phosphatase